MTRVGGDYDFGNVGEGHGMGRGNKVGVSAAIQLGTLGRLCLRSWFSCLSNEFINSNTMEWWEGTLW